MSVTLSGIARAARRAKDSSPRRKPWECGSYARQPRRGRKSFLPGQPKNPPPPSVSDPARVLPMGTCGGTRASVSLSAAPSGAESLFGHFPTACAVGYYLSPSGLAQTAHAQPACIRARLKSVLRSNTSLGYRSERIWFRAHKCRDSRGRCPLRNGSARGAAL